MGGFLIKYLPTNWYRHKFFYSSNVIKMQIGVKNMGLAIIIYINVTLFYHKILKPRSEFLPKGPFESQLDLKQQKIKFLIIIVFRRIGLKLI